MTARARESRRSQIEQAGDELSGAPRTSELQDHRTSIWLHGDAKAEESATLSLGIHRTGNGRQRVAGPGEPKPNTLRRELVCLGALQQAREQIVSSRPERVGCQRASDWKVGHGVPPVYIRHHVSSCDE
jgi:hypothetical protein